MTHALITATEEFMSDETRRLSRGQRVRMRALDKMDLATCLNAIRSTSRPSGVVDGEYQVDRGSLAVELFDYRDSFDENAATVITDILHAVVAAGFSPQAVLNQAAAYYAEEAAERVAADVPHHA